MPGLPIVPASPRDCWPRCAANWSDERGIGYFSTGSYFRSLWAGGGPIYELKRSLSLHLDVAYVHQSESGVALVAGNHLLIQGSLDYHFHKSLGE